MVGFRTCIVSDEFSGDGCVVTVLAKDLKQESSNSLSASADMYLRFGNVPVNILVEGFYTDLRDVFALRSLDGLDANGNAVLERYNGSGARVMGANLEAKFLFSPRSIFAGLKLHI